MKKFLFSFVFAIMAITTNAQVTSNIRLGGGMCTDQHGGEAASLAFQFQTNIPLTFGSNWTFSPSVIFAVDTEFDHAFQIYAPITIGYKVAMGDNNLFIPKFGLAAGVEASEGSAIVGPAVAFDFEFSHFVIGINAYYSLAEGAYERYNYGGGYDEEHFNHHNVNLTIGYKF